jgi:type IV pilus assembly protein PilB
MVQHRESGLDDLSENGLLSLVGGYADVQLLNGDRLRGEVQALGRELDSLLINPGGGAPPRELRLERFRILQIDGYLGPAPTQNEYQTYDIRFVDGRHLDGTTLDYSIDEQGLHLFSEAADGTPRRLFIPMHAVERYRIGNESGRPAKERDKGKAKDEAKGGAAAGIALKSTESVPIPGLVQTADALRRVLERQSQYAAHAFDQAVETPAEWDGLGEEVSEQLRMARALGIPAVRLQSFDIDPRVISYVPEEVARRYCVVPLFQHGDRLVVALENPTDEEVIRVLRFVTATKLEPCLATADEIEGAINRYYGAHDDDVALEELEVAGEQEGDYQRQLQEAEVLGKQKPIVRLVNNIILDAIHRRASDIHIRPDEHNGQLWFRIDGSMVQIRKFSKSLLPAMVARIKVLGRMDISDRRLPQDGQARMVDRGDIVDLRISVIPTVNGESVVIRLLNPKSGLKTIDQLGFAERDARLFHDFLNKSFGMFLVTGPTGSGKSTTLYAALREVRERKFNILTVEDPVEYREEGMEQIQVNTAPGYTFARALKHILRHDPDAIMIGEIRDHETAKIAVESALTGHIVLSTLHTNDAASTVSRLIDMGVEPYLVASALLGVMAQRLVRRNCTHCVDVETVEPAVRRTLGVSADEVFYRGRGCDECNDTGYRGRVAVYELLAVTPALRRMITSGASGDELRVQAVKDGMTLLTQDALRQARSGVTSLAEAYRVRLD